MCSVSCRVLISFSSLKSRSLVNVNCGVSRGHIIETLYCCTAHVQESAAKAVMGEIYGNLGGGVFTE